MKFPEVRRLSYHWITQLKLRGLRISHLCKYVHDDIEDEMSVNCVDSVRPWVTETV